MNGSADVTATETWRQAGFRMLLAASPGLRGVDHRRRAELLAGLLLTMVGLGMLSGAVQMATVPNFQRKFPAMLASLALLSVAYLLSRSRAYQLGAVLACLAPLGSCLAVLSRNPHDPVALPFMVVPVMFATAFLPTSAAALAAVAVAAVVGALPMFAPEFSSPGRWVPAMVFQSFVSVLLVVSFRQRNRIERDLEQQRQSLETELKAAERFATAGCLATGLGHDVNNLLAVMLDLHRQTAGTDPQRRATLAQAEEVGHLATSLIRDMLSVARSGPESSPPAPIDLGAVIRESESLLDCATRKRCRLDLGLHPQPLAARISALDLQRILINLVSNAARLVPQGGSVTIQTVPTAALPAASEPLVAVVVQDSGPGMDAATRARAIRALAGRGRFEGSAGMGLAIVGELVRRHGGTTTLASEPGQGARFTVLLPAAQNM